jgi:hypothetical protein
MSWFVRQVGQHGARTPRACGRLATLEIVEEISTQKSKHAAASPERWTRQDSTTSVITCGAAPQRPSRAMIRAWGDSIRASPVGKYLRKRAAYVGVAENIPQL